MDPARVMASGSEPAGGDLTVMASGSEPAGGDLTVMASGSEPAGGDLTVMASGSEPAGGSPHAARQTATTGHTRGFNDRDHGG